MQTTRTVVGPEVFALIRFDAIRDAFGQFITMPEGMIRELSDSRIGKPLNEDGDVYVPLEDYVFTLQKRFDEVQEQRTREESFCECADCQYVMLFPFADFATGKLITFLSDGSYVIVSGSTIVFSTENEIDVMNPLTNFLIRNVDRVVQKGVVAHFDDSCFSGYNEVYEILSMKFRRFYMEVKAEYKV